MECIWYELSCEARDCGECELNEEEEEEEEDNENGRQLLNYAGDIY